MRGGSKMLAVDPVCRMIISKEDAEFTSKHKGIKYYFCAPSCKEEFDEHPEESLRLYRLLSGISVQQDRHVDRGRLRALRKG